MKKLIFILSLVCFGVSTKVQAQATASLKTTLTGTKTMDTCTNATDTVVFVYSAANMKNGSIHVRTNVLTGSPILTVLLQVSNDGVYYTTRQTGLMVTGDTLNLVPVANGGKVGTFAITQNNYAYYRVRVLGHSSATAQVRAVVCVRRD